MLYTPVIPVLMRLRQEDDEFKASLGYTQHPIKIQLAARGSNLKTTRNHLKYFLAGRVAQAVEHLPSKCEAQSSNSITPKSEDYKY
jgi:hypothetical protein